MPESYKVLLGTYKLDTTEGFEEFMVRLGVSPFMLLSDGVTKPVTIIRPNIDTYSDSFPQKPGPQ